MERDKKGKPPVIITCPVCGKEKKRFASRLKGKISYCSVACYHFAKKNGESNPPPPAEKSAVVWNCSFCGKEITSIPSRVGKYCSPECYQESIKRTPLKCEECGKEFFANPQAERRFCSRECFGKWFSRTYVGESHWNTGREFPYEHRKHMGDSCRGEKSYAWRGGITEENHRLRNCLEYQEWRKSVFTTDDYTCVRCGKHGGYLHAHHLDGFAVRPEFRFDLDNGVTLCLGCHKIVHSKDFLADVQSNAIGVVVRGDHVGLL